MSKRNNIILIGFMGSGKTTFGKWIAANKKMEFVDTDELIEKENGMTKRVHTWAGKEKEEH